MPPTLRAPAKPWRSASVSGLVAWSRSPSKPHAPRAPCPGKAVALREGVVRWVVLRAWGWGAADFYAGPAFEEGGDGGHVLAVEAGGGGGFVDLADDGGREHRDAEALGEPGGEAEVLAGEGDAEA